LCHKSIAGQPNTNVTKAPYQRHMVAPYQHHLDPFGGMLVKEEECDG